MPSLHDLLHSNSVPFRAILRHSSWPQPKVWPYSHSSLSEWTLKKSACAFKPIRVVDAVFLMHCSTLEVSYQIYAILLYLSATVVFISRHRHCSSYTTYLNPLQIYPELPKGLVIKLQCRPQLHSRPFYGLISMRLFSKTYLRCFVTIFTHVRPEELGVCVCFFKALGAISYRVQ